MKVTKVINGKIKKLYYLTDGQELFEERYMDEEEIKDAQELAEIATDGNIRWVDVEEEEEKIQYSISSHQEERLSSAYYRD